MVQINGGGGGGIVLIDKGTITVNSTTYVSRNYNGIIPQNLYKKFWLKIKFGAGAVNMRFGFNGSLATSGYEFTSWSMAGVPSAFTGRPALEGTSFWGSTQETVFELNSFNMNSSPIQNLAGSALQAQANSIGVAPFRLDFAVATGGVVDTFGLARPSGSGTLNFNYSLWAGLAE